MRMTRKVSYAMVAAAIALSTPITAAASPAAAFPAAPAGCTLNDTNHLGDRTVNFWECKVFNQQVGHGHGQILNAIPGDSVWAEYFSVGVGWKTVGITIVGPGATSADSGSLRPEEMLAARACIHLNKTPAFLVACTT
jgi:hypothetical protein